MEGRLCGKITISTDNKFEHLNKQERVKRMMQWACGVLRDPSLTTMQKFHSGAVFCDLMNTLLPGSFPNTSSTRLSSSPKTSSSLLSAMPHQCSWDWIIIAPPPTGSINASRIHRSDLIYEWQQFTNLKNLQVLSAAPICPGFCLRI